jgi:glutamate dehydrogenase
VLRSNPNETNIETMLDTWIEQNSQAIQRWQHVLTEFRTTQNHEFAKFSVALRELMLLGLNCDPNK